MSDPPYETAHDIEARLNRLCGDNATESTADRQTPADFSGDEPSSTVEETLMQDRSVSQFIVRSQRSDSGQMIDTLTGSFRCQFEPSQTVHVLHLPIYPPMETEPEVEVESVCDTEDVNVRLTQAKRFGLRIELKRSSDPAHRASVVVEVIASSKSADQ